MMMLEGENIARYNARIKDMVCEIRGLGRDIEDEDVVTNMMRNFLLSYSIRMSSINELRNFETIYVDELIDKLTTFDLKKI